VPELPELQAHAERLTDRYVGRVLAAFAPLSFTALKTVDPPPEVTVGRPLGGVGRRGKYLLLTFEPATFVVHLMQGGRLRVDERSGAGAPEPRSRKPAGALARWSFDDEPDLVLTEAGKEKRAGVWVVAGDPEASEPLAGLGPDADEIGPDELATLLAAHAMRLHGWLRGQRVVAGIGRRLANEICHRARLSPFAPTAKLGGDDLARLHAAIGSCIEESLAYERSRRDMSSSKERPGAVHRRTGDACPVCGDVVREVAYQAYTVHYCASCQTGGKVLADNTTSRFLK
jgi:formamidopyrimidine-DNA glycosylase